MLTFEPEISIILIQEDETPIASCRKMPTLRQIYSNQTSEMGTTKSDDTPLSTASQCDESLATATSTSTSTVFNFEVTPPQDPTAAALPDVVPKSYRRRIKQHRSSLVTQPSRLIPFVLT